jgi:hypothetical protein
MKRGSGGALTPCLECELRAGADAGQRAVTVLSLVSEFARFDLGSLRTGLGKIATNQQRPGEDAAMHASKWPAAAGHYLCWTFRAHWKFIVCYLVAVYAGLAIEGLLNH